MRVLAVSGRSGAGKTALALSLVEGRPETFARFALDRYYRDARPDEPTDGFFWRIDTLDTELIAADLDRLGAGCAVAMPEYDWRLFRRMAHGDHTRTARLTVVPRPWLVVDGLCAGEPIVQPDIALHLDVPFDVACERAARRAVRYGQEPDLPTSLANYRRWAATLEPEMRRLAAAADIVASSPQAARAELRAAKRNGWA